MFGVEKRFRFLEHMSDAYVEAYGETLEEAFENAALALFEVMVDTSSVEPKDPDEVVEEAEDEQALLYCWLEAWLVNFEVKNRVYSRFRVEEISKSNGVYRIRGVGWGEEFVPEKHRPKVGVKAVTYHMMEILREGNRYVLRFLLDL